MKRRVILLIAIMLVCCALSPVRVMATATEKTVDFVITINPDGSADFVETHTIGFSDSKDYTLYGRIYIYPEGRFMDNWAVTVDGESWEQLPEVDNDSRPDGTFAVEYNSDGAVVTMYHRSNDEDRVFSLSYHVENAVNIYDDIAEFFWDLSSENEISTIYDMTAKVILPDSLTQDDFRIWAHGPLNGVFNKTGDNTANLEVEFVSTYEPVDIRIAMPVEIFSGGNSLEGAFLQSILDEEQALADDANAQREEDERRTAEMTKYYEEWDRKHPIQAWINDNSELASTVFMISVFGIIPFIILYVFITKIISKQKTKKMRRSAKVQPQYYRTLPDKRPPAIVGFLAQYYGKRNYGNYFTATLMDMSLKGHLTMQGGDNETIIGLKKSEDTLLPHERVIYGMLDKSRGDRQTLTLKQLQDTIKVDPEWAIEQRNNFNVKIEKQFNEAVSIEDITKKIPLKQTLLRLLIWGGIGFILLGPFIATDLGKYEFLTERLFSGMIGFAIAIAWGIAARVIIGSRKTKILSQEGEDSLALWHAFGSFIDDFTLFDEKDLPEFPVWKEYLVYAVALGKGERLIKELAVRYPSLISDEDDTYFSAFYYKGHFNTSFFDTLDKVQKTTYQARVIESSGSGDGGGFSSSGGGSGSGSGGGFAD